MTDGDVHTAAVRWIGSIVNVKTIKEHQGGKSPALPYCMVNFTGSFQVRQHEQETEFTELDEENSENLNKIMAAPVIEVEWRFSVHAYGPHPTDILRPLVSAAKLPQVLEPLMPSLVVHEVSQIRNVPDWINNAWEPRAQTDIYLRGLTRDGFVIDTVDEVTFSTARM